MKHIKKIEKKPGQNKTDKKLQEELKKSGTKANVACPELAHLG